MFSLMMMMMIVSSILLILIMILNLVSMKTFIDKEKNSPFECGFDPKSSSRLPFSIQFFLIAIIFLIFDIEISLVMPIIKILNSFNIISMTLIINFFFIILIGGLFHEWNQGALKWMK